MSSNTSISIESYLDEFRDQVLELILHIQNVEAKVGISAEDQPDILAINDEYICDGGGFWVALNEHRKVVGTIGIQRKSPAIGVLKKFFVDAPYRGMREGPAIKLYSTLINFASERGMRIIVLDTPSIAIRSHEFYKRAGFKQIEKAELPVTYDYPDRSSLLFRLDLP